MATKTITERMTRVETLLETFYQDFKEFREEVKTQSALFVTLAKHDEDINDLKQELKELNQKRWIQNTLSAVLGAVLSLLVAYFIANIGG